VNITDLWGFELSEKEFSGKKKVGKSAETSLLKSREKQARDEHHTRQREKKINLLIMSTADIERHSRGRGKDHTCSRKGIGQEKNRNLAKNFHQPNAEQKRDKATQL